MAKVNAVAGKATSSGKTTGSATSPTHPVLADLVNTDIFMHVFMSFQAQLNQL